jgi:phage FluMu protein Com
MVCPRCKVIDNLNVAVKQIVVNIGKKIRILKIAQNEQIANDRQR